jgi:hypothetical protein
MKGDKLIRTFVSVRTVRRRELCKIEWFLTKNGGMRVVESVIDKKTKKKALKKPKKSRR